MGGSNAKNGLSTDNAWKTVAKVNATPFYPGDSILFKKGETWNDTLIVPSSGTVTAPIIISSYGTGEKPIINGTGNAYGVNVSKHNHYYDGLIFRNATSYNVVVGSDNNTFINCTIDNAVGTGIGVNNNVTGNVFDNLVITNNGTDGAWINNGANNTIIQNSTFSGNGRGDTGDMDAIGVYRSAGVIIRNNIIDHPGSAGTPIYCTSDDSSIQSVDIYRNVITQTSGTKVNKRVITLANGTYNFYYNTVIGYASDNKKDPNKSISIEFSTHKSVTNIYNNVFTGVDIGILLWSTAVHADTAINIKNNIFYNPTKYHIWIINDGINAKLTSDYNIFYPNIDNGFRYINDTDIDSFESWQLHTGQDAHSIVADPLFVSSSDFYLQPASPAINAGVSVGLTTDYWGNPVPRGSAPDMGAYEFTVDIPLPASPANLLATTVSSSQVNLVWTDQSSNKTAFQIERKTGAGGGRYPQIWTKASNATTYSDSGLAEGKTYLYRVRVVNGAGNSAYSNEASATTPSSGTGGGGCSVSPEGKSKGESPLGTMLAQLSPGILLIGRKARHKRQNS
jgi:hypothetical protein